MTDLEALQRAINDELYKAGGPVYGGTGAGGSAGKSLYDRIDTLLYLRDVICKAQYIRDADNGT